MGVTGPRVERSRSGGAVQRQWRPPAFGGISDAAPRRSEGVLAKAQRRDERVHSRPPGRLCKGRHRVSMRQLPVHGARSRARKHVYSRPQTARKSARRRPPVPRDQKPGCSQFPAHWRDGRLSHQSRLRKRHRQALVRTAGRARLGLRLRAACPAFSAGTRGQVLRLRHRRQQCRLVRGQSARDLQAFEIKPAAAL